MLVYLWLNRILNISQNVFSAVRCFNKVSSFFLINLNMVFCLCCTKGMPSVCESGPQCFSTLKKLYVYTSDFFKKQKRQCFDRAHPLRLFSKRFLNYTCNVTFQKK